MSTPRQFCNDPRHETPCQLPCVACSEEGCVPVPPADPQPWERVEVCRSEKRWYFVSVTDNGTWVARFQPLNPKTGVPWQADHWISFKLPTRGEAEAACRAKMEAHHHHRAARRCR